MAGVVGRPIGGSLSPLLHNAWIEAAGLDAAYVPFALSEDGFEAFVESLRGGGVRGLNVTTPFKARALACADVADAAARAAGAANLVIYRKDDVLEARNTDGLGLLEALTRQAPALRLTGARVVLFGAGGAARAAAVTLVEARVAALVVVNRSFGRAETLAASLGEVASARRWEELEEVLPTADLVINATSAELGGGAPLQMDWASARAGAVAMDMVYRPLETVFLAGARAQGLTGVDGLEMLIGQARPSFEAFFGQAAPETVDVRALALQALAG